jgi:hypothetical protein
VRCEHFFHRLHPINLSGGRMAVRPFYDIRQLLMCSTLATGHAFKEAGVCIPHRNRRAGGAACFRSGPCEIASGVLLLAAGEVLQQEAGELCFTGDEGRAGQQVFAAVLIEPEVDRIAFA